MLTVQKISLSPNASQEEAPTSLFDSSASVAEESFSLERLLSKISLKQQEEYEEEFQKEKSSESCLKITWKLEPELPTDWSELMQVTELPEGEPLPKECHYLIEGEGSATLTEWRYFLDSLKPLLEHRIPCTFFLQEGKVATWLQFLGLGLLGKVFVDRGSPEVANPKM